MVSHLLPRPPPHHTHTPRTKLSRSLANKADLPGALSEAELRGQLKLEADALALTRHQVVRGVAKLVAGGNPHEGVTLGLEWLLRAAGGERPQLEIRRVREMAEHKAAEEARRAAARAAYEASKAVPAAPAAATAAPAPAAAAPAPASAPAPAAPACTACKAAPAARRCAASKWEAVCEACAAPLEEAYAAAAAAAREAEEAEEAAASAAASAAAGGAGSPAKARPEPTTTQPELEPATPSKIRLGGDSAGGTPLKLITVSAPGSPTAGAGAPATTLPAVHEALDEDAVSPASAAGAPPGGGAAPSVAGSAPLAGGAEGGGAPADGTCAAADAGSAAEEAVEVITVVAAAEAEGGDAPTSPPRSAAAVAAEIESASAGSGGGAAMTAMTLPGAPSSPLPAAPAPVPLSLLPGELPCARCAAAAAQRRAALSSGAWAAVCTPCGDALDSGKSAGGVLDQLVAGLAKVFVPEQEAGEGEGP